MDMNKVTSSLEGWYGFVCSNFSELFKELLRVNLLSFSTFGAGVILAGLLVWLGISTGSALLFSAVGAFVLLIALVLGSLFILANYKLIEEHHGEKKHVSIFQVTKDNAKNYILYWILILVIFVIGMIPFLALDYAVFIYVPAGGYQPIITFTEGGISLVSLLLGFFLQFSLFELVLNKEGPADSVLKSYSLVKKNFMECVTLFVITTGIGSIIQIPVSIVLVAVIFTAIIAFGAIVGFTFALFSSALIFVAAICGVLSIGILVLLMSILATLSMTVLTTLTYRFWLNLSGRKIPRPQIAAELKKELAKRVKEVKGKIS